MKEIEIKVQIESDTELLAFLKREAKPVKEERQIDTYFSPKEKSFLTQDPVKEWLRLRDENGVQSINYKYWHYNQEGKTNHCDEYETEIEDSEQLKSILKALHFEPIITVDKSRQSYLFKDYEISLDHVKELGAFVEIELKSDKAQDPQQVTDEMIEFLRKFNVGKIERDYKGYPKLLLEKTTASR